MSACVIDMTGWKMSEHGVQDSRWTVIKRAETKTPEARWLCECSCENKTQKILSGSDLRKGKTKSCGCLRKEIAKSRTKYKINEKYGALTIIEDTTNRNNSGSIIYRCKCDCGNDNYLIPSEELTKKINNNTLYCSNSIHRIKDLTNQIFGDLIAIEPDKTTLNKNGNVKWLCKCTRCNRSDLVSIRSHDLVEGKSKTCGCGCNVSRGANKILSILSNSSYTIKPEVTFLDLINPDTNNKLRYDFGVYYEDKLQYLIEYDGEQHFYYQDSQSSWNTKDNFIKTKQRDEIKNIYCKKNNIKLYRIPYYDINSINTLEDIIQNKYLIKQS